MKRTITNDELVNIKQYFNDLGLVVKDISGAERYVFGIVGDTSRVDDENVRALSGVDSITRIQAPYKLASKEFHPKPTIINVNGVQIGGGKFTVIAGPCSVENEAQI